MKKKLLMLFMACTLVFGLTACGAEESSGKKDKDSEISESSEDSEDSEDTEELKDTETQKESESEKDTEQVVRDTLKLTVPEGFAETEVDGIRYYQKENVGSNINIVETENDGSLDTVTGEIMVAAMETQLEAVYATDLTITTTRDEWTEINGHKVLVYAFSYTYSGLDIVQTQYILENGDLYEFVTFTDIVAEGYTEAFTECEKTISFE